MDKNSVTVTVAGGSDGNSQNNRMPVGNQDGVKPDAENALQKDLSDLKKTAGKTDEQPNPITSNGTGKDAELVTDPVNMATGEYIYKDSDFIMQDMGCEFNLIRRLAVMENRSKPHGMGKVWTLSTDTSVSEEGRTTVVTMPDGKTVEYMSHGGRYINKRGKSEEYTLIKNENGYRFRDCQKRVEYIYNAQGQIQKKTDKNGNETIYKYCRYGLETVTLPTGRTLKYKWKDMKIRSITDNTGRTVSYEYKNGLLVSVTRCDGTIIKYEYDKNDNLTSVTDGMGCTYVKNQYDEKHRITMQQIADGGFYTFSYNEDSMTNTFFEGHGQTATYYQYDKNKDITSIKYPDGTQKHYETDRYGNRVKCTDRNGAVTTYKYDKYGNLLQQREPSGLVTNYEYNEYGCIKKWDNAGRQEMYSYDDRGNMTEKRILADAQNNREYITTYKYDKSGRITEKSENNGETATYSYAGNCPKPSRITLPDNTVIKNEYDPAYRLSEKTVGNIKEKYTYTDYNKIETYTDGEGGKTSYYYNGNWQLIKKVSPSQNKTGTSGDAGETFEYDCMDRVIYYTDASGRKTTYKRDAYGEVIQERKCGGGREEEESISYEYDICHRLVKKTIGTAGYEEYSYDGCGRMTKKAIIENGDLKNHGNPGYTY